MTPPMAHSDEVGTSMAAPWNGCRILTIDVGASHHSAPAELFDSHSTVRSIGELQLLPIDEFDIVLCCDDPLSGQATDALEFLSRTRPELPVVRLQVDDESPQSLVHRIVQALLAHHQRMIESMRQLRELANTDALTGLTNRRGLNETFKRIWAEVVRNDRPLACMMLDLNRFKTLNDELGHMQGDAILKAVGRVLQANCRQVDVAARFGGDEFCVIMPETPPEAAIAVARRIMNEFDIASRADVFGRVRPGLSIGIAHVDLSRPINAEQLLAHADEAMYASKSRPDGTIIMRAAGGFIDPDHDF